MTEFNITPEQLYGMRNGDSVAFFGQYEFEECKNDDDLALLQAGLGYAAAELWEVTDPTATWEELAACGTYQDYLKEVEAIAPVHCPEIYGSTIADGEEVIKAYAAENGLDLKYVSGITGVREQDGIMEVLLSETAGKDWTHQPHGGARMEAEGAVAALVRELLEEAGLDAAIALIKAFKEGTAIYAGYYASRIGDVLGEDNPKANTLLAIQIFVINGRALEGVSLRPNSDSKAAVWLPVDQLPDGFVTTTQLDYWLRTYFGAEFPTSRYTHPRNDNGVLRDSSASMMEPSLHQEKPQTQHSMGAWVIRASVVT